MKIFKIDDVKKPYEALLLTESDKCPICNTLLKDTYGRKYLN